MLRVRKFIGMRMKQPKSLYPLIRTLFVAVLVIAATGLQSAYAAAGSENTMLVVLQPEDPTPTGAKKLDQRVFTGKDFAAECSHYELLLKAEKAAVAAGADVLKVVSRSYHSRTQPCDAVEVAFYKTENPRAIEQAFQWSPYRRLTWEDFRGGIRRGVTDRTAAETSCGIAIETSLATASDKARVYVFNTFDKQKSWVRPGQDITSVLEHEQGHWDLCELYTRKIQARFNAAHITGGSLKREVSRIYDSGMQEYVERQEQYERETAHGTIASEQKRWTEMLSRELDASSVSKL